MSKFHSIFPEEHLARNFLQKRFLNSWMFFGLRLKIFWRECQNAFYIFRWIFLGKTFVWEGYRFKVFLRAAIEKLWEVLSKLLPHFPEKDFGRKILFKRTYKFIIFSVFGGKFFGRFVKTAFYIFKGRFMENTFVLKKL